MVLFLARLLAQQESDAFAQLGAFGALSYLLSLAGGLLTNKLLGAWKACVLGLGLCVLGNITLAVANTLIVTHVGLAFILGSAGLFSPNRNALINTIYEKNIALKELGFIVASDPPPNTRPPFLESAGFFVNQSDRHHEGEQIPQVSNYLTNCAA